jgi:hypothetical protein
MTKRVERLPVRDGYDRWADTYDATPNPVVSLDRRHAHAGCGTGVYLRRLHDLGARPVGIDFSSGMLGSHDGRRRAPRSPAPT